MFYSWLGVVRVPREVRAMTVKTALNRVAGMPFQWSLNPYRGCQHACVYCYARATHRFLDLGVGDDFSQILMAKANLPEVLDRELARRRSPPARVVVGTATDPYQPIEGRWRITERCLMVLHRHRVPVEIITKGTLIRRDVDLLQRMAAGAGVTVCVSVPTVDDAIWRETEPGTPAPRHRLATVRALVSAGIRAGVLMAPILPGLTDDAVHLRQALTAARDHGAAFVHADVVRLSAEVRPVFMAYLSDRHPDLLGDYGRWFRGEAGFAPGHLRQRMAAMVPSRAEGERRDEPRAAQVTFDF